MLLEYLLRGAYRAAAMARGELLVAHAARLTKSNLGRFVNRCLPSLARIGEGGQGNSGRRQYTAPKRWRTVRG
ncbi:MAG: hypothetical protein CMJ70_07130 [Planctomycetaceae bacterium]|nr:hypothetical protein [Planctomycetaceae bacterium]HAA70452.1 hypothetical protein [Planctomycetaceae bacterium]